MSKTKQKTITLQHGFRSFDMPVGAALGYRVIKVQNSLDYNPGEIIPKDKADELVAAEDWTVNLVTVG